MVTWFGNSTGSLGSGRWGGDRSRAMGRETVELEVSDSDTEGVISAVGPAERPCRGGVGSILGEGGIRGSPFSLVFSESVDSIGDSEEADDPEPRLREDGGVRGPNGVDGGTRITCSSDVVGCWEDDTFEISGDC